MDTHMPLRVPRGLSEDLFTVQDVMTPMAQVLCVVEGTDWGCALSLAAARHYTILPYTEGGRVTGIVRVPGGHREPLTARLLVSRDTTIRALVDGFCANGSELLVLFGQDVVGLVTPADLNKVPARSYFYQVIGSLEVSLARLLQACYADAPQGLLALLSADRRRRIVHEMDDLAAGDADVDPVHQMLFSDLLTCVARSSACRARLGYASRKQAEEDLNGLNRLRNCVMHTVCPMVSRVPDSLPELQDRLERARRVLHRLAGLSTDLSGACLMRAD